MRDEEIRELKKAITGKKAQKARFVEEYILDGNGADAVIRAGVTENRASAATLASRWLREPAVLAYRDALMEAEAAAIGVSRESLIVKSERVYKKCMAGDNPQGAAKALELQGKLIGALTEKREIESSSGFVVNVELLPEERDGDC